MNDEEAQAVSEHSSFPSLTESPLFWIVVFGLFALLGLWAIGDKHAKRQERLVRMSDARDGVKVRAVTGDSPDPTPVDELAERTIVSPLAASIAAIVLVAAVTLTVRRRAAWRRHMAERGPPDLPNE